MKVIERIEEVKKIVGYEAGDGTLFDTAEECEKYEASARYAIDKAFFDLCVKQNKDDITGMFAECEIFENFGYGSEEWMCVILDIKNEEDMKVVKMYRKVHLSEGYIREGKQELDKKYIGQRVLVGIGDRYSGYDSFYVYGTQEELVEKFRRETGLFFNRVIEDDAEKTE